MGSQGDRMGQLDLRAEFAGVHAPMVGGWEGGGRPLSPRCSALGLAAAGEGAPALLHCPAPCVPAALGSAGFYRHLSGPSCLTGLLAAGLTAAWSFANTGSVSTARAALTDRGEADAAGNSLLASGWKPPPTEPAGFSLPPSPPHLNSGQPSLRVRLTQPFLQGSTPLSP